MGDTVAAQRVGHEPHGFLSLTVQQSAEESPRCPRALRLAHFFGTSAEFWLNLQKLYELRLAEKKAGKTIKALPVLKNEHAHA